jgi:PAS domain S-box-containing protein
MTETHDINADLLQQLNRRAEREGCSVNDLLARLLAVEVPAALPLDLYYRLLQQTSDTISVFDLDLRYIYTNPVMGHLTDLNLNDMIGKTDEELGMPAAQVTQWKAAWQQVIETRQEQIIAFEFETAAGVQHFESRLTPILDAGGQLQYLLALTRDITGRKKVEERLRRSEARLRSLVDTQTAFIVRTDLEGRYTYINPAFFERYQWRYPSIDAMLGVSIRETIVPADHDKTQDTVTACFNQPGTPVQVTLRKPTQDGGYFWTLWEFVAIPERSGTVSEIQCIGIDISEQIAANQHLELLNKALQAAANAVVMTDNQANIEWVNPAFIRLTGYTLDEAYGKNPGVLVKSGHQDDAFYADMWNTILAGRVWTGQLINRRKDGTLYTEEQTITPVKDSDGRISHFIAIKQDITERERSQQFMLNYESLKARFKKEKEQNLLIQQTIAALSHDLRTPLAVIATTKDILSRYFDRLSDELRQEKLDSIGRQLQYVIELLDDTVEVTRSNLDPRQFRPAPVNLAVLCQVSVEETGTVHRSTHDLRFVNPSGVATVTVDEILVSRILLNLLSNAVKYSPDGGEIRLELDRDAEHVILRVVDHGMGIASDDLPHIFDLFYRSDAANRIGGTGLGLSIVLECVERHWGQIHVESEPGQGSTFIVELPVA